MADDGARSGLVALERAAVAPCEWDDLVRRSPDGWAFGLWGWQELILSVAPWRLQDKSFALRENGRLVAVVPLQFNPDNGVMASSGWGGAGPILAGGMSDKGRRRIMNAAIAISVRRAQASAAAALEVTILPVTQTSLAASWGVNPFALHGLEDVSGLSRVIDLSLSEDRLWQGLSSDTRRQIRMAMDAGYIVERADWPSALEHYYQLHCETYRRTGVPPHPQAYFSGIAERMAGQGCAVLWSVRDKTGTVVGYHNDAVFGQGAYYHTACSTTGSGVSGAGYLLFWQAMLGARRAGTRWYDCGAVFPGANDPKQRGLTTFKTKFGGETHRLFRARHGLVQPDYDSAGNGLVARGFGARIGNQLARARSFLRRGASA